MERVLRDRDVVDTGPSSCLERVDLKDAGKIGGGRGDSTRWREEENLHRYCRIHVPVVGHGFAQDLCALSLIRASGTGSSNVRGKRYNDS